MVWNVIRIVLGRVHAIICVVAEAQQSIRRKFKFRKKKPVYSIFVVRKVLTDLNSGSSETHVDEIVQI